MPARERSVDRGRRNGARMVAEVGEEIRRARVAEGVSQGAVARAAGLTHATVSRLERGVTPNATVLMFARVCATVGLISRFGCTQRVRRCAIALTRWSRTDFERCSTSRSRPVGGAVSEPLGTCASGTCCSRHGADGPASSDQTRPRDGQELERRMSLKRRDGSVDSLILVLPDTRSNRDICA